MSASNVQSNSASKASQGAFSAIPSSNSSLLKFARRSTPDSEALASSDDEPDAHRQEPPQVPSQPQKPMRRSSWLNDTSQMPLPIPRKGSFASNAMSPTTTQAPAPTGLAENASGPWYSQSASNSSLGRGHQAPTFGNWGSNIWGNNERKEPPARLSEVLPSPTSSGPPSLYYEQSMQQQTSPPAREQGNTQIPFAIPLHPTPKTYRSQSYSVGQLDPDSTGSAVPPPQTYTGRSRPMGHPGLQHRPSRPSMLSEMSSEALSKVKEVDDDDDGDSTGSSGHGSHQHHQSQAKQIESLVRENAMLRQQQQYQTSRIRPRASTAASYGHANGYSVHQPVPEESDFAVDELDESHEGLNYGSKRNMGRRMSEYAASAYRSQYPPENRKLENVKKAFWTSSLGFGGIGDVSQSRRHSFADIPTRQGSISSIGEGVQLHESQSADTSQSQDLPGYPERAGFSTSPVNYYPNNVSGAQTTPSGYGGSYPSPYGLPPSYSHQPPSPHRNIYGMGSPRHNQLLQIVLFKCSRAEVFYIQEGTGLTVKPGDLVIVEADRGTDLGTVACDNLDWQKAKEMKEHYSEEHYKWLMMYSANAAAAQDNTGGGMMAASNGFQGSAIGGMGPPNQHHLQEPNAGELKPKLIKRLAQSHEIHSLRDKEGNEAKAKRVCMQKVKEHGLNMEILDAEFQMDWKKLTFYYFADAYINFNSLVTDLFKIYKTRIWMSAINPASFATPTLGLQAPSGIGPGAVGHGRSAGSGNNERRPQPPQESPGYPPSSSSSRSFAPSYNQSYNTSERSPPPASGFSPANLPYAAPYGAFSGAPRAGGMPFVPGMMQAMDSYPGAFQAGGDYPSNMRGRFPSPHAGVPSHEQSGMSGQNDWAAAFQGLSLNSR